MRSLITGPLNRHVGILILRLVFGGTMMFAHGMGKLMKGPEGFADPLGIGTMASWGGAVFSEFFCAFAVMLGLAQRLALIPLMFTMAVAALVVHGADPFQKRELALVYLGAYAALFFTGAGKLSVDAFLRKGDM